MPSNAPAMRMAGPITSAGWPRLQPGATRARIPGTAALAGSDCLPLSTIIVALEPIALAMDLPAPFAWLVDEAGASPGPDRFLAELGGPLVGGGLAPGGAASPPGDAGRRWLAGLAAGRVHEDTVGSRPDGPSLGWVGPRPFTPGEADELHRVARFAAAPLAVLAARATLTAALQG